MHNVVWGCAEILPKMQTADRRLQTADRIQNVDQVQNVNCRVGKKCRMRI